MVVHSLAQWYVRLACITLGATDAFYLVYNVFGEPMRRLLVLLVREDPL